MSGTDNTERDNRNVWGFSRGAGRYLRRKWQKRQRQAQRVLLQRQEEPDPARPRSSVKRDYW